MICENKTLHKSCLKNPGILKTNPYPVSYIPYTLFCILIYKEKIKLFPLLLPDQQFPDHRCIIIADTNKIESVI